MFNHLHSIMKKYLLSLCFLLAAISLHAQNDLSDKGYFGLKLGATASVYQLHTYSISAIPYYKITPKLDAGLGFGLLYSFVFRNCPAGSLPFFADVKYDFLNKRVRPFIEAQVGINLNLTSTESVDYTKFGLRYLTFQLGVSVRHSDFSFGIMSYDFTQRNTINIGWQLYGNTYHGSGNSLFLRYAYNFRLTD